MSMNMSSDIPTSVALADVEHSLRFVQAGGWRTRVMEVGSVGFPLLLMHGTGGHLEAYAHNVAALASQHRVIAFDFAGHGYTTHATQDLESADYVEQIRNLMDALGLERAHLGGESLGGWMAVKFAAAYPERVGRLMLNTPGGTMARADVMERIRSLSQGAADDPSDERIRTRLEWLMADPATVTDELVSIRQAIYSRPGFSESMKHILCLQNPTVRQRNLITDEDLAAVPNGAMVIWTSDDPSGPASAGIEMAERIRDGRFEYLTDAGHWPQWEQRQRFNDVTLEYLRGFAG
jgi:2-hydroxy-6-oxonona-2,4-dienedioate hydrolase